MIKRKGELDRIRGGERVLKDIMRDEIGQVS